MKVNRIIKRQGLKQETAFLKARIAAVKPFMDAEKRAQQIYQAGVQAGFQEAMKQIEAIEQDKKINEATEAAKTQVAQAAAGIIPPVFPDEYSKGDSEKEIVAQEQ